MRQPVRAMRHDGLVWADASRRLAPFLDITIAVAATTLAVGSLLASDVGNIDPNLRAPDAVAIFGTVLSTASLLWRRSYPATAYCAFVAGCLIVTLTGHYIGLLSVVILFALYSLAAHGRRRTAAVALAATLATFAALAALDIPDLRTSDLLQAWALLITAWAVGDGIRARRGQQREHILAAEQDAALAREQSTRAVAEERLRIARELHDLVAHSMSLIAVQAGVGAHVIRKDADAAERALQVIAETSRGALAQTRSMLGMLRDEDDAVSPVPHGVDDLPALIAAVRSSGLDAYLEVSSPATTLESTIDLAAYRIVQESLTNVLTHGGPSAHVRLTFHERQLELEVTDPGGSSVAPSIEESGGHGLIGLTERAHLLGGTLEAGPAPDGGFRVHAVLPINSGGVA
ncbi:MAG: sensor histidine kinase [Rhodococcus sp. (in: high G+C Gram-positive bacteria)]